MNILSFDPSGNHATEKEGSGTTGLTIAHDFKVVAMLEIKAEDFETTLDYWDDLHKMIEIEFPDHVIIEGYKLYNHKGMSAQTQANSTLMTSQLIGALRMKCYQMDIPVTIQYASDVKTRWSDAILEQDRYLGAGLKFQGKRTNMHKRDSLRHLLHFTKYKLKVDVTI